MNVVSDFFCTDKFSIRPVSCDAQSNYIVFGSILAPMAEKCPSSTRCGGDGPQLQSIVHPLKRGKIKLNRVWKHIGSHGRKVPLIHEMWGSRPAVPAATVPISPTGPPGLWLSRPPRGSGGCGVPPPDPASRGGRSCSSSALAFWSRSAAAASAAAFGLRGPAARPGGP